MRSSHSLLGEYLRARRESLQPEDVGLVRSAGRRVPGLRREEVAALAGVSQEYYLRIEQGKDNRPSEQVLRALARALVLDHNGLEYIFRLARPRPHLYAVESRASVTDGVRRLLEQWPGTPAYVTDAHHDVLASNALAQAISPTLLTPGINLLEASLQKYVSFMVDLGQSAKEPEIAAITDSWERVLRQLISAMRFNANPDDPRTREIVKQLSSNYRVFQRIWAEHDPRWLTSGMTRVMVERFGWVACRWQTLGVPNSPGQFLTTLLAEPGSPAAIAFAESSGSVADIRRA